MSSAATPVASDAEYPARTGLRRIRRSTYMHILMLAISTMAVVIALGFGREATGQPGRTLYVVRLPLLVRESLVTRQLWVPRPDGLFTFDVAELTEAPDASHFIIYPRADVRPADGRTSTATIAAGIVALHLPYVMAVEDDGSFRFPRVILTLTDGFLFGDGSRRLMSDLLAVTVSE